MQTQINKIMNSEAMKAARATKVEKNRRARKRYPNGNYKGKRRAKHRIAAEKALGRPLLCSYVIHHVDGDPNNWQNTNLVICPDQEYHHLLHKRTEQLYLRELWIGMLSQSSLMATFPLALRLTND